MSATASAAQIRRFSLRAGDVTKDSESWMEPLSRIIAELTERFGYRRITDDRAFGEAVKNLLFDQYLRSHRAEGEVG